METAEAGKLIIGSDLPELVAGQDQAIADVVDLVLTLGAVAEDHVGGGAGGRRQRERRNKAVAAAPIHISADDLAHVIDVINIGPADARRVVDGGVDAGSIMKP